MTHRPTFDELIAEADAGWCRDCDRPLSHTLTPAQSVPGEDGSR